MSFNSFIITQMTFQTITIFLFSITLVNAFPLNRNKESFMNDIYNVLSDLHIENKEVIKREQFHNVAMKILGYEEGKTNKVTEDTFNEVCRLIEAELPEGDISVKSIPDILDIKKLTARFGKVMGGMKSTPKTKKEKLNKEEENKKINSEL